MLGNICQMANTKAIIFAKMPADRAALLRHTQSNKMVKS